MHWRAVDCANALAGEAAVTDATAAVPAGFVAPEHPPSEAMLSLGMARDGTTTRLLERTHFGPLRVQKALYPEGPQLCHAVIVHPPGGIVGGDRMQIDVRVGAQAQALLTTPGASKWYRAIRHASRQSVRLTIDTDASLEWLPQETIFFDAAQARMLHEVEMAAGSVYIGGEILCFGRSAAGETFGSGSIEQRTTVRRDGRLIWFEQGSIAGGGGEMQGVTGLGGSTVCATLIAVGDGLNAAIVDALRTDASRAIGASTSTATANDARFGVSLLKTVLVARYLGHSSALARDLLSIAWRHVRPVLVGRAAVLPRIWQT